MAFTFVFSRKYQGSDGVAQTFGQNMSRMSTTPVGSGQEGNCSGLVADPTVPIINTLAVIAPLGDLSNSFYVNPMVNFSLPTGVCGAGWSPQVNLTGSDAVNGDASGKCDISGTTLVFGNYTTNGFQGEAYVFDRANPALGATDGWTQTQILTASDGVALDEFGFGASIYGDTAVFTAPGANGGTGAAYVFTRVAGVWSQVAKIIPADLTAGDSMSVCLLLGTDLFLATISQNASTGAVYWYKGSGATWTFKQKLTGAAAGDAFGFIAYDGVNLVIGSPGANSSTGKVGLYRLTAGLWTLQDTLVASDAAVNDQFGSSVAVNGPVIAVGSPNHATHGQAYVFIDGIETQTLPQSNPTGADLYGSSISLGIGSPSWIAVGAPALGTVYFFSGPALALDPTVTLTFKGEKVYA